MAQDVFHKGRIIAITPELTSVEIISESACSSCHAKGLCSMSESKAKVIELPTSGWKNYAVGDEVNLVLKASMGHKAVWIGYVIPLFILVAVLLAMLVFKAHELVAALGAIGAVAVYYFVIFLLRSKLKNEFIFNIQ